MKRIKTATFVIVVSVMILSSILVPNSAINNKNQEINQDKKHTVVRPWSSDNETDNSTSEETSENSSDDQTEPLTEVDDTNSTDDEETLESETSETSDLDEETSETDSSSTETSTEDEDEAKFELEIQTQPKSAEISSKVERAGIQEEFESSAEFSGEPKIEVKYKSGADLQEIESEIGIKITSIIEFEDNNKDRLWGTGDTLVQTYNMDEIGFKDLIYTQVMLDGGVTDNVIEAETNDGVFLIRLHIVGDFATVGAVTLKPTAIKIDFEIYSFPLISNTSLIALSLDVESSFEIESEGKDSLEMVSNNPAYFSWLDTAQIDNQEMNVSTNIKSISSNEFNVDFIYAQGTTIVHDPEVGVRSELVYNPDLPNTSVRTSNLVPFIDRYVPQSQGLIPESSVSNTFPVLVVSSLIFVLLPVIIKRRE